MKKMLNSTASVVLCLSMAIPAPLWSQAVNVKECAPRKKERDFPCLTESGIVAQDKKQFRELLKAGKSGDVAAEEIEEEVSDQAEQETAEAQAAEEARAAAEAEEAEKARQAAAEAEELKKAQQAAAEAEAAERAAEEVRAAEQEEQLKQAEQAAAEQIAEEERAAAEQQRAEEDAATRRAAEEAEREKEERKAALKAERKAQREAEKAAAAATALTENAADAEGVEVTTEEVTEENTRSSDEEFATSVDGAPTSTARKKSKDDDGLSNFEKALLLGLGAVVVGKVLNNGDEVVSTSGDRVVVERDGELRVLKNDDTLLRQPGSNLRTETFNDGSTRTTVLREDGSQIVTIRAADGRVLSRTRITPEGEAIVIFDDTQPEQEIEVSALPKIDFNRLQQADAEEDALARALEAELGRSDAQRFSLRQVRDITQVRMLAPEIELTNIRFETGSAAIRPEQARRLAKIGTSINEIIDENPRSVILIEGHTDAVGSAAYNLALSDRRAESVALALTEYFDVPPENLIVQGYGESSLKIPTQDAEPANRRAVVRNITPLLR